MDRKTKRPRNPVVRSPLMKKGGRHERSKSAGRMKEKEALRSEISETDRDGSKSEK